MWLSETSVLRVFGLSLKLWTPRTMRSHLSDLPSFLPLLDPNSPPGTVRRVLPLTVFFAGLLACTPDEGVDIVLTNTDSSDSAMEEEGDSEESTESTEDILRQKTRLLRSCPKRFAAFRGADPSRGEVELLMEGEKDPRVWKIDADAEIKIHGYWGRLEDLRAGPVSVHRPPHSICTASNGS